MKFFHVKNTQLTRKWPSSIQQGLWCHSCQHGASKAKQGPKQKHTWLTVAPLVCFCSDTQCWWSSWPGLSFWCIGWWAIHTADRRWRFWAFNQGGGDWMVYEKTAWKRKSPMVYQIIFNPFTTMSQSFFFCFNWRRELILNCMMCLLMKLLSMNNICLTRKLFRHIN